MRTFIDSSIHNTHKSRTAGRKIMDDITLLLCALVTGANTYGSSKHSASSQSYHYRQLLRILYNSGASGKYILRLMQGYIRTGRLVKSEIVMALEQVRATRNEECLEEAAALLPVQPRSRQAWVSM